MFPGALDSHFPGRGRQQPGLALWGVRRAVWPPQVSPSQNKREPEDAGPRRAQRHEKLRPLDRGPHSTPEVIGHWLTWHSERTRLPVSPASVSKHKCEVFIRKPALSVASPGLALPGCHPNANGLFWKSIHHKFLVRP